jgi:hypothetical protein
MDISKWPKGLPYPTSWLRAIALSVSFFGIIYLFWQERRSIADIGSLILVAWFLQIPLMAGCHYGTVQLVELLEKLRSNSQNVSQGGSWQHWKEGFAGFLILFIALLVTAPIANALVPISWANYYFNRWGYYYRDIEKLLIVYGILSAIASAYFYYWKIPSRIKSLVIFCWPLLASFLKSQVILLIPVITSIPFLAIGKLALSKLSDAPLGLTTFLLILGWFCTTIAAFATIHYYTAHWLNGIAKWWPPSFPGYNHLQQKKAQKHHASVNNKLIYHETSWNLASLDFIILIYANVLSSLVSLPIIFKWYEKSSSPKDAALYITVCTVITINLWHFWGRDRAKKIMSKNLAKTAPNNPSKTNKKAQKPQKSQSPLSPVDSIEVELNEMSADFGMTLMRQVRKNPNPDETKWYVFRGGESEGPYTRNQLWLARRITARTKVRRESETEWTIAGKIPELKDFLKPQK